MKEKEIAQNMVGFDKSKKNIVWISNPKRLEKNFKLEEAVELLDKNNKLQVVINVAHEEIYKYMYSADLLLLTSLWEGSPNVIKEALACNLPVVSTDVGDVRELIDGLERCYICEYNAKDLAEKIKASLDEEENIQSRKKIGYLDEIKIADKLINVYKGLIKCK